MCHPVLAPTLIALLLELVALEEDLAIQLLVSGHLLLLLQRKLGSGSFFMVSPSQSHLPHRILSHLRGRHVDALRVVI